MKLVLGLLRKLGRRITTASYDLVLPPGLRWVDLNVIYTGCVSGLIVGYKMYMLEALVLFPRPTPCSMEFCMVCGHSPSRRR